MKKLIILCLFTIIMFGASAQYKNDYAVLINSSLQNNQEWMNVAKALQKRHRATLFFYDKHPRNIIAELREYQPRYVAVIDTPENLNANFVVELNRLSRMMDEDIYADFLSGIITGYTASDAMRMVTNSEKPFVIKTALNTTGETSGGKWYSHFAWIDDGKKYVWGEKTAPEAEVVRHEVTRWELLNKFVEKYESTKPNLLITSSHASEVNLEMPFSLGDIRSKGGRLYADYCTPKFLTDNTSPRVYYAAGNCLIGNIDNTKESMAVAWLSGGGATSMVAYVVPTWYGRNGWGGLKYWFSNPNRYTLAEAVFLNQQEMIYKLEQWNPAYKNILPDLANVDNASSEVTYIVEKTLGKTVSKDEIGFLHDRDVVAFYGDPKWDVKLQNVPSMNGYTVKCNRKGGNTYEVVITTNSNLNINMMKGDKIKQVHVEDIPFSYFFPERIISPRLATDQNWNAVMSENFLMIYDCNFEPNKTYKIKIESGK